MYKLVYWDTSFATYLSHRFKKEFQAGICTHYLAWYVSLKQFKKPAVFIWVSIHLDKGAAILKLLIVKKVQIVYLLKQLCSHYRITSEWNGVALLSFHYQRNTRTPSVSLCANHAMRQWFSHHEQTQGSMGREYVKETNSLKLSI